MKKKNLQAGSVTTTPTPQIKLGKAVFSENALFTNILVLGGLNAGQFPGVVYPLLKEIANTYQDKQGSQNWGGLIFDAAGTTYEDIMTILQQQGRNLKDVYILDDKPYYIVEFEDTVTKKRFFASATGSSLNHPVDEVLLSPEPNEHLTLDSMQRPAVHLTTRDIIPLCSASLIQTTKELKSEFTTKLTQLIFNSPASMQWVGWKAANSTQITSTLAGKAQTISGPTKVRFIGIHALNPALTYNLLDRNISSAEAATRFVQSLPTGLSTDIDTQYKTAAEKLIANCIEMMRLIEGPLGNECTLYTLQSLTTSDQYLNQNIAKLRGVVRAMQQQGQPDTTILHARNTENFFNSDWLKRNEDFKHRVTSYISSQIQASLTTPENINRFCSRSSLKAADCMNKGSVFIIPGTNLTAAQQIFAEVFKRDYQACINGRLQSSALNKTRFQLMLSENLLSPDDVNTLSIGRQSRTCTVAIMPALSTLLTKYPAAQVDRILQMFNSKIFMQNQDKPTNSLAQELTNSGGTGVATLDTNQFSKLNSLHAIIYQSGNDTQQSTKQDLAKYSTQPTQEDVQATVNNYYIDRIEDRIQQLKLENLLYQSDGLDTFKVLLREGSLRSWINGCPVYIRQAEIEATGELIGEDESDLRERSTEYEEPQAIETKDASIDAITPTDVTKFLRYLYPNDDWSKVASYDYSWERFKTGNPSAPGFFQMPMALFGEFGTEQAQKNLEQRTEEIRQLVRTADKTKPLSNQLLELLRLFPTTLPPEENFEVPPEAFDGLSENLPYIFKLYQQEPNPQLEMVLKLDPETTYLIELPQTPSKRAYTQDFHFSDVRWYFKAHSAFPEKHPFPSVKTVWSNLWKFGNEITCLRTFLSSKDVTSEERLKNFDAMLRQATIDSPSHDSYVLACLTKFPELIASFQPSKHRPMWAYLLLTNVPKLADESKQKLESWLTEPSGLVWALQYIHDTATLSDSKAKQLKEEALANCDNPILVQIATTHTPLCEVPKTLPVATTPKEVTMQADTDRRTLKVLANKDMIVAEINETLAAQDPFFNTSAEVTWDLSEKETPVSASADQVLKPHINQLVSVCENRIIFSDHSASMFSDPTNTQRMNMVGYLPVLKIPLSFYGVPTEPTQRTAETLTPLLNYSKQLEEALKTEIHCAKNDSATYALKQAIIDSVAALPIALYNLSDEYEVPISLFNILHTHIFYVYKAFESSENPDSNLEALLSSYPEYVYRLIKQKRNSTTLGSAIRSTFNNPTWAIKAMQATKTLPTHGEELLRSIANLKDHDAYSSIIYKDLNPATPIDLKAVSTQMDAAITYALAHPKAASEPALVAEIQHSPLWSYNWLNLTKGIRTDAMLKTLIANAPWGIQYLHDVQPPDAEALLRQICLENKNPYWQPWILQYLQRGDKFFKGGHFRVKVGPNA